MREDRNEEARKRGDEETRRRGNTKKEEGEEQGELIKN